MDVNDAAVLSCITTGVGESQLLEQHAALDLPSLTSYIYRKSHLKVSAAIRKSAWSSMKEAGKEEARLARDLGEVTEDGIPMITVIADGAWRNTSDPIEKKIESLKSDLINSPSHIFGEHKSQPLGYFCDKDKPDEDDKVQEVTGLDVQTCGLFLHKDYPYLTASPDGLVADNGLLEVKCPASAAKLSIVEAIQEKKLNSCL
ncbi:hypothetical protein PPYR_02667 [Photinus pyralis]|uniref:Uncharacterized protein n=1 Tax=Photinus pyralis TaxID=7054 RepID=A0A5N4B7W2_PHOPY|nr:hypothetical protein PPYR_02667 [Photinus pyralis]